MQARLPLFKTWEWLSRYSEVLILFNFLEHTLYGYINLLANNYNTLLWVLIMKGVGGRHSQQLANTLFAESCKYRILYLIYLSEVPHIYQANIAKSPVIMDTHTDYTSWIWGNLISGRIHSIEVDVSNRIEWTQVEMAKIASRALGVHPFGTLVPFCLTMNSGKKSKVAYLKMNSFPDPWSEVVIWGSLTLNQRTFGKCNVFLHWNAFPIFKFRFK